MSYGSLSKNAVLAELMVVGEAGWARNQETGVWQPVAEGMVYFARGHEFHMWLLALATRYYDHRWVGEEVLGERPFLKLSGG
ncbi:MAG: hypothetical protein H6658_00560 [Ardenticatenaceae bacterium]|nr:hypothetical protein [Ardenticatenaceae bacterium]